MFGMDFRFSRNRRFTTCALRWDRFWWSSKTADSVWWSLFMKMHRPSRLLVPSWVTICFQINRVSAIVPKDYIKLLKFSITNTKFTLPFYAKNSPIECAYFCAWFIYNLVTEDFISKRNMSKLLVISHCTRFQSRFTSWNFILTAYSRLRDLLLAIYIDMHLRIGESPSICPFLKNNGDEAPKGPSPIIFRNGQIRGLSPA